MYQTTVKGEGLFQALSQGYGEPVRTFGVTEKGETPVSLVNIGLAACVTMCVQGYYASQEGNKTMPVQVESRLDNERLESERRFQRRSRKRFLPMWKRNVKSKLF
ncbi:TPA: OsmC family peroxiredoxin [Streptococcus suis]